MARDRTRLARAAAQAAQRTRIDKAATATKRWVGRRSAPVQQFFVVLFVVPMLGLICLAGIGAALKYGLWGEFVFAVIVMTVLLWILAHSLPRFWEFLHIEPPTWWQAPVLTAFVLVGLPLAIANRWWGVILFAAFAISSYWILYVLATRTGVRTTLVPVACAGATVAAMVVTIAVAKGPARRDDRVSDKVRLISFPGANEMALRYRPVLRFDGRERFAPLDIDAAIKRKELFVCRNSIGGNKCDLVEEAGNIDDGLDYLELKDPEPPVDRQLGGRASAYYFHATKSDEGDRVYLDYWWYFAENPNPRLRKIFCGPGLRAPGILCFEHPADWEGVTVVLAPCDVEAGNGSSCRKVENEMWHAIEVHYARHTGVANYGWKLLEKKWQGFTRLDERPLVFVALDSHASYPKPCRSSVLGCANETSYDGAIDWSNNTDAGCRVTTVTVSSPSSCLQPLPVDDGGNPSRWDAFRGPWGAQTCILFGAYCDAGAAPTAPPRHKRYKKPWEPLKRQK
jgi:hypothetical protein